MGRLFQFQTASRLTPGVAGTHEAAYIFPDSFQLNPGIYDIIEHGAAFPVPDTSRLSPGVTVEHLFPDCFQLNPGIDGAVLPPPDSFESGINVEHGPAFPVPDTSRLTPGVTVEHLFPDCFQLNPGIDGAVLPPSDSFELNPGINVDHGPAFPVPDTSRLTPGVTVKHRIDMEHGAALPVLPDSFQTDGVVFAFAAYYRNSNPVRFQLWRPVESTDTGDVQTAAPASSSTSETTMRLLGQLTITPSVQDSRETVCTST